MEQCGWVRDQRLKQKGELAELLIASDLRRRGFKVAIPFGEDGDYDLIADTGDRLHRVQVKYAESDGIVVIGRCRSQSLTAGKVRRVKRYTSTLVDWIAVFEATTERCFYIPSGELGDGREMLHLRLARARNGQRQGIRLAKDYCSFPTGR